MLGPNENPGKSFIAQIGRLSVLGNPAAQRYPDSGALRD